MMAVAKAPYDPIKAIEGMFNGSVTRIAQALKSPAGYSGSTKQILAECAKRFHDALDDCEIQLLDAKWYLEQQLRTKQLRREAQAREKGAAAKRKHDEMKGTDDTGVQEQASAKKVKLDQDAEPETSKEQEAEKEPLADTQAILTSGKESDKPKKAEDQQQQPQQQQKPEKEAAAKGSQPAQSAPSTQATKPVQSTEASKPAQPPPADDFAKPSPQATPIGENDGNDDLFDFGLDDPGDDLIGNSNKDDDDLSFSFNDDFGMPTDDLDVKDQNTTSLDTLLLPGLENYANLIDDSNTQTTNTIPNTATTEPNTQQPSSNTDANANSNTLPSFSNNDNVFDLPNIGDTNIDLPNMGETNLFDEYFNADNTDADLGGLGNSGTAGDFDDLGLNMDDMDDMNFDAF